MSRYIAKFIIRPLAVASAAIFFHISVASAADVQQQMKELLTGTTTAHFASQSGPRDGDKVTVRTIDSQEFVKRVLLGRASSGTETSRQAEAAGDSAKTQPRERPVAYRDSQVAVRHVLLGQSNASDAS